MGNQSEPSFRQIVLPRMLKVGKLTTQMFYEGIADYLCVVDF